ncbi:MAG: DUF3536 domain-containing protein [Elusimicrobiaceae bacterium]
MKTSQAKGRKFVVIHGHFYQPPRENPWLNHIEEQSTAAPAHDWNERIAEECYNPNGTARINGPDGAIADLTNNYEFLNFDFGPTLLTWYEKAFPEDYQKILDGHKKSAKRLGAGNGIAQAYNHIILPLAPFRDRLTQVLWGIEDFRHRFGEYPSSLWCPETACNDDILKLLIDVRMKYVILDTSQVQKVRKCGTQKWLDVSNGSIDPRRPYIWHDRGADGEPIPGRSIAIFFYDGPVSKAVAFEDVMRDSYTMTQRINACFDAEAQEDQVVSISTDGESYGHHRKFADLTLAHLFKGELVRHGFEITNYAAFLEQHPPLWEAVIKPGEDGKGTSWSCAHGVARWREDCGCGREGQQHQRWRAPMRSALDWLNATLAGIYEKEGSRFFRNAWDARNDYIRVMLDGHNLPWFINKNCVKTPDRNETSAILRLLEMQKYSMFMYTSCGWFFSDISRIEAVQNLKYAARAIELAGRFGYTGLEEQFKSRLEAAPSNFAQFGNGRVIYERLVRPSMMSGENVIAEFGMRTLFRNPGRKSELYSLRIDRVKSVFRQVEGCTFSAGLIDTENKVTGRKLMSVYFAALTKSLPPRCYVSLLNPEDKFEALLAFLSGINAEKVWGGVGPEVDRIMGREFFGMGNIIPEARRAILEDMYRDKIQDIQERHFRTFSEYLPIIEHWHSLELGLPEEIRADAVAGARKFIMANLEEHELSNTLEPIELIRGMLPRIKNTGLQYMDNSIERLLKRLVIRSITNLRKSPNALNAEKAVALVESGLEIGALSCWLIPAQNAVIKMMEDWHLNEFHPLVKNYDSGEHIILVIKLLNTLKINVAGFHASLNALRSDMRKVC